MKRALVAFALGVVITLLPWLLRPLIGDQAAVLWLPGFLAISHWFPRGLRGPDGNTARLIACVVNVPIWAGTFLLASKIVHWQAQEGRRASEIEGRENG
jgi:hypothetical protein